MTLRAFVEKQRSERVAQVVGPRVLDTRRRERPLERPPAPRLVRRLRPRLAVYGREDEAVVRGPPRREPPFGEVRLQRPDQPNGPALARLGRVSALEAEPVAPAAAEASR